MDMVATGAFGTGMQLDVKAQGRVQRCVNKTSLHLTYKPFPDTDSPRGF